MAALPLPPGPGRGPAELVPQRDAPDLAERDRVPGPDRLQVRPAGPDALVHHVAGAADQRARPAGQVVRRERQHLPGRHRPDACRRATIYGFNGTFPGPRINAEYGKPVLVRFENHLDENPLNLDRQDFGSPDFSFLTHLHNGAHGAGVGRQPALRVAVRPEGPRLPGQVLCGQPVPELAGRQRRPGEAELLLVPRPPRWTTPGRTSTREWSGSTRSTTRRTTSTPATRPRACACPGVRTNHADGTLRRRLRHPAGDLRRPAGRRRHRSTRTSTTAWASSRPPGNPRTHPEWWGKTFFKHFPNHGFVGDIFTVNGTAYPVLEVKRRKYRFRFLDALDLPDLRAQAHDLDRRAEVGPRPRLRHGRRPAGPVADRGRPAGHELDRDRRRRRAAAVPDHPGLVRAVAGEAARAHRRLHQVQGRLAHQEGRRHLPDQRHEDARRPDVVELARGSCPTRSTRSR